MFKTEKSPLTKLLEPKDKQLKSSIDCLPKTGYYIWVLVGKRGSGKSNLLLNALENAELYKKHYDNIFLISPTANRDDKFQALCKELSKEDKCYEDVSNKIVEEILERIQKYNDEHKKRKRKPHNLIIFDDCISMLPRSTEKGSIFNKLIVQNRHYKTDVFITTQQFKKLSPLVRSNIDMISFFRNDNVMEKKSFMEEYNISEELLDDATDEAHSFLHICFNSNKPTYFKRFDKYV
jgi:hypothetical protein